MDIVISTMDAWTIASGNTLIFSSTIYDGPLYLSYKRN